MSTLPSLSTRSAVGDRRLQDALRQFGMAHVRQRGARARTGQVLLVDVRDERLA